MIEIVYDKTTAEKNGKNEMHYKMPKNIRQIGNAPDKKKIYIEDYVMTFLERSQSRVIRPPGELSCLESTLKMVIRRRYLSVER